MIKLSNDATPVIRRALQFYYDNLNDDQAEGGDHMEELSNLDRIFRDHPELSPE